MTSPGSGYALFRFPQFRRAWSANLVFNLGLAMLTLGIAWTMTSLTDSTILVSMVQTASSLPFVMFAIPLGIATDAVGHRGMVLASQVWMLGVTAFLAAIALADGWSLTPRLLLLATFLLGLGVVVHQAGWKPMLCELVPRDRVVAALSFNSLSTDIGRAAGPVAGGYLMRHFGTAVVLFTSTVSHIVVIAVLVAMRRQVPTEAGTPGQHARAGSLRQAWVSLRRSPNLYGPVARTALVMIACGALLGLLPLEAKENIQTGPIGYGGLLAALAIGSATGAILTPILQQHFSLSTLSAGAIGILGLAVIGISRWDSMLLDAIFLLFYGCAFGVVNIIHISSVQLAAPENSRGLMTAVYLLTLQGAMAAGSFGFGLAAQHIGVSRSILAAGLFALSGLLFVRRFPVREAA